MIQVFHVKIVTAKTVKNVLNKTLIRSKVITHKTLSHASDHLCQIWKENPSRTTDVIKRTQQDVQYSSSIFHKFMAIWPWRYRSRAKVIAHGTPSHASYHLRKESIHNYRHCRADITRYTIFYTGQGQKSFHATHLLMLVIICAKNGKNPPRIQRTTEWTPVIQSIQPDEQAESSITHKLCCEGWGCGSNKGMGL